MNRARRLVVGGVVVLSGLVLVPDAGADPPEVTGWWASHRARQPTLGLPGGERQVVPPDSTVPSGGLYVAGEHATTDEEEVPDPNGSAPPNAPAVGDPPPQRSGVSAVRFFVGDDAAVGDLVLTFHKENGTDRATGLVAIQACPSTIVWAPEEGGPIDSTPPFDCSTGLSFGAVVGSTVRIPVGSLVRNDVLNIVLLPQPGSAFTAVFAKPGPEAITVTRYPRSGGDEPEGEEECEACLPPTVPDIVVSAGDPIGEILALPPVPPTGTAPAGPAPGTSRRIASGSEPQARPLLELEGWKKALAGGVLGALTVLYLWLLRLPQRSPRLLGALATPGGYTGTRLEQVPRGIGRFARPRTGPPPRL